MGSSININCRQFHYENELDEQRRLFIDCFPENIGMPITTTPYYMWKFHSIPSNFSPSYEYVALKDNKEMVGYYAGIPYHYIIDGKDCTAAMVCDVMTSSLYRGAGIFTGLGHFSTGEFAKHGFSFSTGYPIRKSPLPGHLKVGWKIMFDMPLYMRFLSANSLLKSRGLGWVGYLLLPFIKLHNLICWKPDNRNVKIRVFSEIEEVEDYQSFESAWRSNVRIALCKSIEFMKWRLGAPGKKYKYVCAYVNNRLVGIAIVTDIIKEGVPSMGIVDFMILSAHKESLNSIHNALKRLAKDGGKEAIMTMMSCSSSRKYRMFSNAYLRSPFTFHFIIKKFNGQIPDGLLSDERNWELRFIDSDDL